MKPSKSCYGYNLQTDLDKLCIPFPVLCLTGQWEKPFNGNLTHKADFHVDENTKVEVDMMKRLGRYDYYHDFDNHTSVIKLPYKGRTSMIIVLPDEGKMKEVEASINKDFIKHWHDKLRRM